MKFKIYAGLMEDGSESEGTFDFATLDEAYDFAYDRAVEKYQVRQGKNSEYWDYDKCREVLVNMNHELPSDEEVENFYWEIVSQTILFDAEKV